MALDMAEVVGRAILEDMELKKLNQAMTLDCKFSVKVDGDVFQIDPQLLFQ